MDETLRTWGRQLATFRSFHGLSQDEAAQSLGVAQSTIARWEQGHMEPTRSHKVQLAELYQTDVAVLFPLTRSAA